MTAHMPPLVYFGDTKEDPFKVLGATVIEVRETEREGSV
jgi:hypothetical protein